MERVMNFKEEQKEKVEKKMLLLDEEGEEHEF